MRLPHGVTFLLFLSLAPVVASARPSLETSYRIEIDGSPAGWMVSRQQQDGDLLTSESTLEMQVRRGSVELGLALASRFVETRDGRPVQAWSRQSLGPTPTETTYTFQPDGVHVEYRQGDERRTETLPAPDGEWLTPGQAENKILEMLRQGREQFEVRALDPLVGLTPVVTSWELVAREVEVVADKPYKVRRFRQRQSLAPQLTSTVDLDSDGRMIRTTTSLMGLEMTLTLANREAAQAVMDPAEAPELLVRSFITPDRPIPNPRQTTRAVYEVFLEDGDGPPELPSLGDQRVHTAGDHAVVTVELGSSPRRPAAPGELEPYLRPSLYLNHEAPALRKLLARALQGAGTDSGQRAEAIRTFVAGHLQVKSLDTVLGTASEAATLQAGDCTEHSVLVAALLRAAGIPARVVVGLLYVDHFAGASQIFGYHMWAQAWIDDRWVDLDATTPRPFDAAHIALATSSLNDEGAALLEVASVAPLFGKLGIRIREIHQE